MSQPVAPAPAVQRSPRKKGRAVLWFIVVLWLACLVGLYWMVVRLKLGGEEGIRDHSVSPAPAPAAPAAPPVPVS